MAAELYKGAVVPKGVTLSDPEDYATQRQMIFDDAKSTLIEQFPKEHNGVRMELIGCDYADKDRYTYKEQKQALHNDAFLARRLRGTVRLTDIDTGGVLDEKVMTLMRVPYLTDRGTFIREGNEWGTINQQRMLPGAYTRFQNNGDLETQFNVRAGTGSTFRVNFSPETSIYKFNVKGSDLHMYSLLKDLGVTDSELADRWGEDILSINADKYDARVFEKAYNKIVPEWDRSKNPNRSREDKAELIRKALDRSQVSTNVIKKTLPNMLHSTKSAEWKITGEFIEKSASLTKSDIEDIAVYIGEVTGNNIDIDKSREAIVNDIKSIVRTGILGGDMRNINAKDLAAAAVRRKAVIKLLEKFKEKTNKVIEKEKKKYGY